MSMSVNLSSSQPVPTNGLPLPRRYWAIFAIAMGITLSVLDGAIANVALPTIATDLNATPATSIWVVNAYQLATVISLLSLSALGDMIGYRKIYISGLVVFTLASLACAFSRSLVSLTLARTFQGFGSAAIASVNTSLIRIIYPQHFLGRGMGINALVVAVSSVAGPTVAAGVLSVASWPWLFAVNLPVGIAAFILSCKFLPENPVKIKGRRFDWRDGVLNALAFGLLIASIEGYAHGMGLEHIVPGIILALVVGYFFVRRQLRNPFPILPLDLLRIPIFSLSIVTSICSFLAQMLAMVSLPFFMQEVLGRDEVSTGLLMTAWPVAIVFTAPVAGLLVERVHAGILGAIGLSIFSMGLFFTAFLPDTPTDGAILWRLALCGLGFGLFQSPNNSIIISSAPAGRSGGASGMLATARLLGQTTGAALVALFFHLFPSEGMHVCLFVGGTLAGLGAMVSSLRISQPLPEALRHEKRE